MYIRKKKGQSTVEYVLLMTAVIAVIIALVTSKNSGMQGQMNQTLNGAIEQIGNMSDRLANSEGETNLIGSTPPYNVTVAP